MANEHGWRVQFFNSYPSQELTPEVLSSIDLEKEDLSALLYIPLTTPDEDIKVLHEFGIPVMMVDYFSELASGISYDNFQIGPMATAYLLELGHRRIAHVTFSDSDWCAERKRAYMETLARYGLTVKDRLIVEVVKNDEKSFMDCISNLRDQRVTAVFCANDHIAIDLIAAGKKIGWQLSGSLALIGVDDDIESRQMDLSTVQKNSDAIGEAAFKALVNHIDGGEALPKRILLNGSLLKRGSTEFITTICNK